MMDTVRYTGIHSRDLDVPVSHFSGASELFEITKTFHQLPVYAVGPARCWSAIRSRICFAALAL
jgi:hypothetical protein